MTRANWPRARTASRLRARTASRPRARTARRFGLLTLLAIGATAVFSPSASAHGIGGTQPTNYETTITRVDPRTPGLHVEVVDTGTQLRLTNDAGHDVYVLGYDGERYLRVGPRGVFENRRSPATYLNRSATPTSPPRFADSSATPVWQRVSDGTSATWHDHRTHWMGSEPPPAVQRDDSVGHLIDRWTVELRSVTRPIAVHGTLAWVPPPSPWPAVAIIIGTAALVIGASRTRWWRGTLVVALIALVACAAAHTIGLWDASLAGIATKIGESVYAIVGIALSLLALVWARRRGVEAAVPLVLVAAVFLLVATGLGDIATIGHSQVPSSLPSALARLVVTLTIGLGIGLAVASALRLHVRSGTRPLASRSATEAASRSGTKPASRSGTKPAPRSGTKPAPRSGTKPAITS